MKGKCIRQEKVHGDLVERLKYFKPNESIIKLAKSHLQEELTRIDQWEIAKKTDIENQIGELEAELATIEKSITGLNEETLIDKFQEKRKDTNKKKQLLEYSVWEITTGSKGIIELFDGMLQVILNPLTVWNNANWKSKKMLLKALFWHEVYFDRNTGYRTPETTWLKAEKAMNFNVSNDNNMSIQEWLKWNWTPLLDLIMEKKQEVAMTANHKKSREKRTEWIVTNYEV